MSLVCWITCRHGFAIAAVDGLRLVYTDGVYVLHVT